MMDDPALPAAEHRAALDTLARLNRIGGVARSLWPLLAAEAPASVLELGSGGGDIAVALARQIKREGVELDLQGSDLSSRAVELARTSAARARVGLDFIQVDALEPPLPEHDIVMCSLMLHHLETPDALRLLENMGRAARKLAIVCDLDRSTTCLALTWAATRILGRSQVAQNDGDLSVRAAFRPDEALELARAAGLPSPRVVRSRPCRWILTSRPEQVRTEWC
jgi:2-polyprenyl-3-methyl-5-hydroxy-6-metoxy-1,4-benzoquinol methylase